MVNHFCFVILHYGEASVTMSAVESVLALNREGHKVSVVVVDNASPNGTGLEVKRQLENLQNVYLIQNDENLGFAKGNNVGFRFAKQEMNADFIVLMNNDAVIESRNFIERVSHDYEEENFAVLGPSIRTPNGKQQNPLRKRMLKGFRLKLTVAYLYIDVLLSLLYISPIASMIGGKIANLTCSTKKIQPINGVELHGSFLVFSPVYIQLYDGLDERTFMYCEEEILFARCQFHQIKTRFNPEIKILHNEKEDFCGSLKNVRKKRLFRVRNCLKSLRVYSKVLQELF